MVFSGLVKVRVPILVVWCMSILAFARGPELCRSVTDAVFPCALLLLLSFTVRCAVLFVFWCNVPLWSN